MRWGLPSAKRAADAVLRRSLERLHRSRPALLPEYPLQLNPRWGWGGAPHLSAIAALLEEQREAYDEQIEGACELLEWARAIPRLPSSPGQPCWENDYWGTVDALVQVAALRRRNPALYLEVGSGFSTLFARRAISDFGLRTRIVSVDPAPRREVAPYCDEVISRPLEQVSTSLFERLAPGDIVLVDGSHVALMNTDATVFFLEMLPRLAPGVLLGIDDIFLPWDYPPQWTRRLYGEQYLLACLLLGGGAGFTVRFPGWWVTQCSALAARFDPLWPIVQNRFGRHSTSFWLEREPFAAPKRVATA